MKFTTIYAQALCGMLYLASVGWLTQGGRNVLYEVVYMLGWRRRSSALLAGPVMTVPSVRAVELLAYPPAVHVVEQDAADGNVTGYELLLIAQLAASRAAANCFEIGTFDGRTALNLAANVTEDGRVFTLDLPAPEADKTALRVAPGDAQFIHKEQSGVRFAGSRWADRITQLYGDSATFDFAPYESQMDLVFIDGAHSYDYVKKDTETALRLLKPEWGVILWHDYGSPWWKDLTRAMNELQEGCPGLQKMRHIQGTNLVMWERSTP